MTVVRVFLATILVIATVLGGASPVAAQAEWISVQFEACDDGFSAEVGRLVLLEVAGVESAQAVTVQVVCGDGFSLEAQRADGASSARVLDRVKTDASRLVALAVGELVDEVIALPSEALEPTPAVVTAAPPGAVEPVPGVEAPVELPEPQLLAGVWLGPLARVNLGDGELLWGGAVGVALEYDWMRAELDLDFSRGSATFEPGAVDTTVSSAGLRVGAQADGTGRLRAAMGLRAGLAQLEGDGLGGRQTSGLWGGPAASAGAAFRSGDLEVGLNLEAGVALWTVGGLVNGRREVDVGGPFLGARVDVALFP